MERTGIRERRKAAPGENANTMAVAATERVLAAAPGFVEGLDLIVGATYTPHDTIFTLAHAVQLAVGVDDIPTISISSACSSLLNAVEIVEGYFALGKATRAIVVVSEHNTAYNNELDTMAGHLWGDGAAALLLSKERLAPHRPARGGRAHRRGRHPRQGQHGRDAQARGKRHRDAPR